MDCIWVLIFIFYMYLNKTHKPTKLDGYEYGYWFSISDECGENMNVFFKNKYKYEYDSIRSIDILTHATVVHWEKRAPNISWSSKDFHLDVDMKRWSQYYGQMEEQSRTWEVDALIYNMSVNHEHSKRYGLGPLKSKSPEIKRPRLWGRHHRSVTGVPAVPSCCRCTESDLFSFTRSVKGCCQLTLLFYFLCFFF